MQSKKPNGISDPLFLNKLETFADWARNHEVVTNVQSITDVFKRLNRDLNGGDAEFYRIPGNRELSAQYLLLYELSLPFGLDLNNQIDIDKSSTQVIVTIEDLTTNQIKAWIVEAETFLKNELGMDTVAAGPTVMFSYIAERNIQGMLWGTLYAVLIISGIILIALKDVRLGLLSLVPNLLPAALAFGVWGLFVGQVNMAVAVVTGMALGVMPDAAYAMEGPLHLVKGDTLLLLTDGLEETTNGEGELFGSQRVIEVVNENRELDAVKIVETVFETLARFSGGAEQEDDYTMIVAKVL